MVVFRQSGCIRAKVVAFGQKWLFSGKSGCIRIKDVVFGQSGCIRVKLVFFVQKGLYSGKWLYLGKSSSIIEKWFYSGDVVVFGQKML